MVAPRKKDVANVEYLSSQRVTRSPSQLPSPLVVVSTAIPRPRAARSTDRANSRSAARARNTTPNRQERIAGELGGPNESSKVSSKSAGVSSRVVFADLTSSKAPLTRAVIKSNEETNDRYTWKGRKPAHVDEISDNRDNNDVPNRRFRPRDLDRKGFSSPLKELPKNVTSPYPKTRSQSAPTRPIQNTTFQEHGCRDDMFVTCNQFEWKKVTLIQTQQFAQNLVEKLRTSKIRKSIGFEKVQVEHPNELFRCGSPGEGKRGRPVRERVTECFQVTADVYAEEFGGKSKGRRPKSTSIFTDEPTTTSYTSSDAKVREHQSLSKTARSIIPNSSISGSSANDDVGSFTIDISFESSCSNKSNNVNNGILKRPLRVLKVKQEDIDKHQQIHELYRKSQKTVRFPDTGKNYLNEIIEQKQPQQHLNNSTITWSPNVSSKSETPSDELLFTAQKADTWKTNALHGNTPVAIAHRTVSPLATRPFQRRPRGSYSDLMGDEVSMNDVPGCRDGPMYVSPSEYQRLRNVRLEMFQKNYKEHHALPDNSWIRQPNTPQKSNKHSPERHRPRTPKRSRQDELKRNARQNLISVKERIKPTRSKQDLNIEKMYNKALQDLEAQDQIIHKLMQEYEKTKEMLSKTKKELDETKSRATLDSGSATDPTLLLQEFNYTHTKLESEMQANQSLLQQFQNLKDKTKCLRDWLQNPMDAHSIVSTAEITCKSTRTKTISHNPIDELGNINKTTSDLHDNVDDLNPPRAGSPFINPDMMFVNEQYNIARIWEELSAARSNRLNTVEALVKLNQDQGDGSLDTKELVSRLQKIKRERKDHTLTESIKLSSPAKELNNRQEVLAPTTSSLRMSNDYSKHRKAVTDLEEEFHSARQHTSQLRKQLEYLSSQLQSTKREHDQKAINAVSDAKLLHDEIRRMKESFSVSSSSSVYSR